MSYNGLPRIRRRPVTAGTWDLTRRERLANDMRVRFNDNALSRSRNECDLPLYTSSTVSPVRFYLFIVVIVVFIPCRLCVRVVQRFIQAP